jgi:uncharacterized BrkB/YihY/UPF0761 family membrane protein
MLAYQALASLYPLLLSSMTSISLVSSNAFVASKKEQKRIRKKWKVNRRLYLE